MQPDEFLRIGFTVDRELLSDRSEILARCEYSGHTSEIVIVPLKSDEESKDFPVIETSNAWPYVGLEMDMNCTFHTRDGFRYTLSWKCPHCKDETVCCSYRLKSAAIYRVVSCLISILFS